MSELEPKFTRRVPPGDDRERLVCDHCHVVRYENPKVVVGSVVTYADRILLVRRAIDPRKGHWTLPAGFMELGETPAEGAAREAYEEARATIEIEDLLAVYTIRHISQVQMIFRARLRQPTLAPGPESLEVGLFSPEEIPDELAFPSVRWALDHHAARFGAPAGPPFVNPEPSRPADGRVDGI